MDIKTTSKDRAGRWAEQDEGPQLSSLFKTESTRELSNFNFQWTKTLYQNNLKNIAFFFTFFKG